MAAAYLNPRIGFTIGEDYAFHGLALPSSAVEADVVQGYEAGRSGQPTWRAADRFVRKWLQLRLGAWRRNRAVSEEVTPDYLRSIDLPRCPVSQVLLTHATGRETDWSIDRICNDGAYAPGNIGVTSTRINLLKGDLSAEAILEEYQAGRAIAGLDFVETERLAGLVADIPRNPGVLVRRRVLPAQRPPGLPMCLSIVAQDSLLNLIEMPARARNDWWGHMEFTATPPARSLLVKFRQVLANYVAAYRGTEAMQRLWDDETVWGAFRDYWRASCGLPLQKELEQLVQLEMDISLPHRFGWGERVGLPTKGYAAA